MEDARLSAYGHHIYTGSFTSVLAWGSEFFRGWKINRPTDPTPMKWVPPRPLHIHNYPIPDRRDGD